MLVGDHADRSDVTSAPCCVVKYTLQ